MTDFVVLLRNFYVAIAGKLSTLEFPLFGYTVNLLSVLIVFVILSMVVSIFWKGARG